MLWYAKMVRACSKFFICTVAYTIPSLAFDIGHSACWPHHEYSLGTVQGQRCFMSTETTMTIRGGQGTHTAISTLTQLLILVECCKKMITVSNICLLLITAEVCVTPPPHRHLPHPTPSSTPLWSDNKFWAWFWHTFNVKHMWKVKLLLQIWNETCFISITVTWIPLASAGSMTEAESFVCCEKLAVFLTVTYLSVNASLKFCIIFVLILCKPAMENKMCKLARFSAEVLMGFFLLLPVMALSQAEVLTKDVYISKQYLKAYTHTDTHTHTHTHTHIHRCTHTHTHTHRGRHTHTHISKP